MVTITQVILMENLFISSLCSFSDVWEFKFYFSFFISYPLIIDDIISEINLHFTFPEESQAMILNLLQRLSYWIWIQYWTWAGMEDSLAHSLKTMKQLSSGNCWVHLCISKTGELIWVIPFICKDQIKMNSNIKYKQTPKLAFF